MSLSTVAFFYLTERYKTALALVGVAALTRITALMFWVTPLLVNFVRISWKDRLLTTPLIILLTIATGLLVDYAFYGHWTASWWNFYYWNIAKGVSTQYGKEPFLYHFKVTIPLMINTCAVYFGYGLLRAVRIGKGGPILFAVIVFVLLNSALGHKETRFLATAYPFLLLFCAFGAQQIDVHKNKVVRIAKRLMLAGMIASQVLLTVFYSRAHYGGAYEIVDKLRDLIDHRGNANNESVFFLTPCHVTPFQGYLNRDFVLADFVKCHPVVVDEIMPKEDSEARDQFQSDPLLFVKTKVIDKGFSYIVLFEGDLPKYEQMLKETYRICARSSKTLIPRIGGSRARGDAIIYCKQ